MLALVVPVSQRVRGGLFFGGDVTLSYQQKREARTRVRVHRLVAGKDRLNEETMDLPEEVRIYAFGFRYRTRRFWTRLWDLAFRGRVR